MSCGPNCKPCRGLLLSHKRFTFESSVAARVFFYSVLPRPQVPTLWRSFSVLDRQEVSGFIKQSGLYSSDRSAVKNFFRPIHRLGRLNPHMKNTPSFAEAINHVRIIRIKGATDKMFLRT